MQFALFPRKETLSMKKFTIFMSTLLIVVFASTWYLYLFHPSEPQEEETAIEQTSDDDTTNEDNQEENSDTARLIAAPPVSEQTTALEAFMNMPQELFIEDFEYLVRVLEENWPVMGLSYVYNGVDAQELIDNFRRLITNPELRISPHGFFQFT
jgi:hypothetical protein